MLGDSGQLRGRRRGQVFFNFQAAQKLRDLPDTHYKQEKITPANGHNSAAENGSENGHDTENGNDAANSR